MTRESTGLWPAASIAATSTLGKATAVLLTAAGLLALNAAPALAQSAGQGASGGVQLAQASPAQAQRFDIPAGDLQAALLALSQQVDLQLLYPTELTAGLQTQGVQGSYTPEDALRRLIAGTGLVYRFSDASTVTLVAAQEGDGPLRLAPINVEARGESGTGPVEGFRARNSVSATNVDAPLIETPATVNVLTGDFLDTIGARKLEDALQYVPGVAPVNISSAATALNIRGFESQSVGASSSVGGDALRIDGFRTPARRYHFDPALYERIDILKGGSSLLYGTASPGGLVQFVTKRPEFERRTRIEGTLGSFETSRLTLDTTGPLGEGDKFAYRLVATGLDSNQPFHGDNDDRSFDERLIVNPQLTWLTPGGGELRASYEYSQHDNAIDPGIKRLADGSFTFNTEPFLGPDSKFERENHIGMLEFTQPLGDAWELNVAGAIGRTDFDGLWDASFGDPDAGNMLSRSTRRFKEDFESEELRAELKGDFNTGEWMEHQLTVGVSYLTAKNVQDNSQIRIPGVIDALNPVFGSAPDTGPISFAFSTELEEKAIYVQDFISIGEKLKVFGGLRFTDAESILLFSGGGNDGSDEALDYTIGAIYNHNNLLNPFISYS